MINFELEIKGLKISKLNPLYSSLTQCMEKSYALFIIWYKLQFADLLICWFNIQKWNVNLFLEAYPYCSSLTCFTDTGCDPGLHVGIGNILVRLRCRQQRNSPLKWKSKSRRYGWPPSVIPGHDTLKLCGHSSVLWVNISNKVDSGA